eukprot:s338_g9.t1
MSVQPSCSVLSGPSFLTCSCDPTMPADFVLQRCDRLRIRVNAGGDLRAEITATLRLFVSEERLRVVRFLPGHGLIEVANCRKWQVRRSWGEIHFRET